jgi:hypothetical protein
MRERARVQVLRGVSVGGEATIEKTETCLDFACIQAGMELLVTVDHGSLPSQVAALLRAPKRRARRRQAFSQKFRILD